MDSQYKLLSELLSGQAAFITSPKTSLANYWGGGALPPTPSVYGPAEHIKMLHKFHFEEISAIQQNLLQVWLFQRGSEGMTDKFEPLGCRCTI